MSNTTRGPKIHHRTLVQGVGVNDAPYQVRETAVVDGKRMTVFRCPYHNCWDSMIRRVYSPSKRSHENLQVCEEWHSFMSFRKWAVENHLLDGVLDKDLRSGESKIYSPATCKVISPLLNSRLASMTKKGEKILGCHYHKGNDSYQIKIDGKTLGYVSDPLTGHFIWLSAKAESVEKWIEEETDEEIKAALDRIVRFMRKCLAEKTEFTSASIPEWFE